MHNVIYPGTFDPITLGHIDLIKRASRLFDTVIVCIPHSEKKQPLFTVDERIELASDALADVPNVEFCSFFGLTVDLARDKNCSTVLLGVRTVADYEYELQLPK